MAICDICGQEVKQGSRTIHLYSAKLLKRSIAKSRVGSTTASQFRDFTRVAVIVCRRHDRQLWVQRFIAGSIAFLLAFLPLSLLAAFLVPNDRNLLVGLTMIFSFLVAFLLARRINYEGFMARLLTYQPKSAEAHLEYFTEKKYLGLVSNATAVGKIVRKGQDDEEEAEDEDSEDE